MIYRVRPSIFKDFIEHALGYGIVANYEFADPYFKVTTDKPFPDAELEALGFEVWE